MPRRLQRQRFVKIGILPVTRKQLGKKAELLELIDVFFLTSNSPIDQFPKGRPQQRRNLPARANQCRGGGVGSCLGSSAERPGRLGANEGANTDHQESSPDHGGSFRLSLALAMSLTRERRPATHRVQQPSRCSRAPAAQGPKTPLPQYAPRSDNRQRLSGKNRWRLTPQAVPSALTSEDRKPPAFGRTPYPRPTPCGPGCVVTHGHGAIWVHRRQLSWGSKLRRKPLSIGLSDPQFSTSLRMRGSISRGL